MTDFLDRASLALISGLATTAARSLVLAGAAGAALAVFRTRVISLRLFTWTAALYGSLALPLLAPFLSPVRVPVPQSLKLRIAPIVHSHAASSTSFSTVTADSASNGAEAKVESYRRPVFSKKTITRDSQNPVTEKAFAARPQLRWSVIAAAIYLMVTFVFLLRLAAGIVWSRRLVRNSQAITEPFALAKLASLARQHVPRLVTSQHISVPVTVGVLQPTVLLPSNWREWDAQKFDAVLAHELSHVCRRDALTQHLALLYRTIFWFSPLAWWLNQHLATLAEQASDEAALSGGADQNRYARMLLDFFEALQTTPGRIRWQGVSMARAGQAEQRLERILAWKGAVAMNVKRSLAAAILVLAIPVLYLAGAVRPAQVIAAPSNADLSQQPATPQAPSAPSAAPIGGVSPVAPVAAVPAVAPIAPTAPVAAVASSAPIALVGPEVSDRKGFSYHYGFDDEERFVIVSGKSDSFTMSGSTQDIRHVKKLKEQIPGDFIWFQRDEKSYIIRDQATVDRARGFWTPQEELGKKQEELGKQQEALGKQQEELGAKMEQIRVNVPDMTAELDRLKAKLQKLGPTATVEQIGDLQSEIGELQSKIGGIQSHAGEEQSKLGALQGELGEKQGKLGEQQGELGRQQAELAEKAARQMKELLDEAIKKGTAKPEEEIVKTATL